MRPTSEGHRGKTPVIACQDPVDPLSPQTGMEGWSNQPELEDRKWCLGQSCLKATQTVPSPTTGTTESKATRNKLPVLWSRKFNF